MVVQRPFRLVKRLWRSRKSKALLLAVTLVLFLAVIKRTDEPASEFVRCHSGLSLSEAVFPWERRPAEAAAAQSCASGRQQPSQSCLSRAKAALGHAPYLAVIGDSRGRYIYISLVSANPPMESVWEQPASPQRQQDVKVPFAPGLEPHVFCSIGLCSSNATSDLVKFRFLWNPFFDRHFSRTLRTLLAECQEPHQDCPDMVLLNGGFWYSDRVPRKKHLYQHEKFAEFRRGLLDQVAPLARLARRTLAVWKLEEAMLFEFVPDKYRSTMSKAEYVELLMVQQALVYELTMQVPELVIWSSLLPEVTRHMFHVCARKDPRDRRHCPDAIHMGESLQRGFSDTMLKTLCRQTMASRGSACVC